MKGLPFIDTGKTEEKTGLGANIIQFGHKVEMPISYPSGVVRR